MIPDFPNEHEWIVFSHIIIYFVSKKTFLSNLFYSTATTNLE